MNFNNFTIKSQEAVQQAVELVQSNGQQVVETPHLLKAIMLKGEEVVQFLFGKIGVNLNTLTAVVDNIISGFPKVSGGEPYLSRETNNVLQKAVDKSSKAGDQFVSLEYILLALVAEKNQLTKVLNDAGVSEKALQELAQKGWLADGALCVVEVERSEILPLPTGYEQIDERVYGLAKIHFLIYHS